MSEDFNSLKPFAAQTSVTELIELLKLPEKNFIGVAQSNISRLDYLFGSDRSGLYSYQLRPPTPGASYLQYYIPTDLRDSSFLEVIVESSKTAGFDFDIVCVTGESECSFLQVNLKDRVTRSRKIALPQFSNIKFCSTSAVLV